MVSVQQAPLPKDEERTPHPRSPGEGPQVNNERAAAGKAPGWSGKIVLQEPYVSLRAAC